MALLYEVYLHAVPSHPLKAFLAEYHGGSLSEVVSSSDEEGVTFEASTEKYAIDISAGICTTQSVGTLCHIPILHWKTAAKRVQSVNTVGCPETAGASFNGSNKARLPKYTQHRWATNY